mgnify:CR=1 FL=1
MPNWSSTTMYVYGDRQQLMVFAQALKDAWAMPHSDDPMLIDHYDVWLGKVWLCSGYTEEQLENRETLDVRGYLVDVDYDNLTLDVPFIIVHYESSWDGRVNEFDQLLAEKYPLLHQVSRVSEPGMGVFYHTDKYHRFISDEYELDCCYHNNYHNECYSSKREFVREFNMIFGTKFKKYDDCLKFEANFEADEDHYADDFICINEYVYSR